MHIYLFHTSGTGAEIRSEEKIVPVLDKVAHSTETRDLVISLYLFHRGRRTRGTAYVREWLSPDDFTTARGFWKFSEQWPVPADLPYHFKLIRMCLTWSDDQYPMEEQDGYGWLFRYESVMDHLALLFAHELHHFRRFHLDLHPGQGEHSANRWALQHTSSLDFDVRGRRVSVRKKRKKKHPKRQVSESQHITSLRSLQPGTGLIITRDPGNRYCLQKVTVLRPLRKNARRIAVQTRDGKKWRWPVECLAFPDPGEHREKF